MVSVIVIVRPLWVLWSSWHGLLGQSRCLRMVWMRVMDGNSSGGGSGVVVIIVPGIYIRTCVIVICIGGV